MKYAFIQQYGRLWPVSVQCRVLQVSAAGYYAHLVRRASDAQRQRLSGEALLGVWAPDGFNRARIGS